MNDFLAKRQIKKSRRHKQKSHRQEDKKHLEFIRSLPCLTSGFSGRVDAHHLTIGRYRMGRKLDDRFTVPLQHSLHVGGPRALHEMGERAFWNHRGIDPRPIADFLWENTGDFDACNDRIRQALQDAHTVISNGELIFQKKI